MKSKIRIAISIFSVTVIIACLVQTIPKYSQLREYNAIIEKAAAAQNSSHVDLKAATPDGTRNSTADEVDYITTQEYKDTQNRIDAVKERSNLLKNGLTSDLTDITKTVFNHITEISAKPDDENLITECRQYMTDEYFTRFKGLEFERESYMVYDIKFSDLDKDDITAYVMTRSSKQFRFFVTYSFDTNKSYVISNIQQIIAEE